MERLEDCPTDLLIDGEFVSAEAGSRFQVYDPSTEEPIANVAEGETEDIDKAVSAAQNSFQGDWDAVSSAERGRFLNKIAEKIRENADRLAEIESLNVGKPISEAKGDIETAARYFEYYAGVADKIHGESIPLGDEYVDFTVREPLGVTGHIVPWNFPLQILSRSLAPSLAAGNACVVKPAEQTPLTALFLGRLAMEAGLPSGTLNIVPGYGDPAGVALSNHSNIDGISFTGSVPVGKQVAQAAMNNLNPVNLELGGKSPLVVDKDIDTQRAIENIITALFATNTGQVCSAGSRVLVHEEIHDVFVEDLASEVSELTIGRGLDNPDIGPLISSEQLERVTEYIKLGREEVGEPVIGGGTQDRQGHFVEPTIFDEVENDTRLAQEEIFGPVLCVTSFSDEAEALKIANDTEYGLVAGIFTEDLGFAQRFARDIEAGHVYVNEWFSTGVETPFGGYKNSGLGREKGLEALHEFTQIKNICLNIDV